MRVLNVLLKNLSRTALSAGVLSAFAGGSACVPQEVPILVSDSTAENQVVYQGFTGLVTAQTMSASKVQLSWNQSYDPYVVAYNIYDVSNLFTPRLIKSVHAPATFTNVTSLTPGQLYIFRVRATDSSGKEDTNKADLSAIPFGGAVSATVQTSSSALITYNDPSNADQAEVYCGTGVNPTSYSLMATLTDVSKTSTVLTGLTSGTPYKCRVAASVSGFTDNNTTYVTFTPMGQATHLSFSTQPGSGIAGAALTTQPVVRILDANDNIVTAGPDSAIPITLTLSASSPTAGTIRGTATVTSVAGVATFTGLNLQEAGSKIITATKPDTSTQSFGSPQLTADSDPFLITPGAVDSGHSLIAVSPAGPLVANGIASYSVNITLADQYANPISGIKPQFTSSNGSDALSQPTANTDVTGLSSGSISATVSGTRVLAISSPSGLTSVTTNVVFVAGAAYKLAFTQQPANSPAGSSTINNVVVSIQDQQGNVVTTDNTTSVTLTISSSNNPGSTTLGGTTSVTAVNGVATFNGLGITVIGAGYKLLASSSPSLVQATSNSFNVTSGGPVKIAVTGSLTVKSGTCSSTAYTIQLQDASSNPSAPSSGTTKVVALSGLGSGSFYSSSACTGAPVTSLTYNSSTHTKTLYLKDNKAESLTLTATETSLTSGSLAVAILPTQIALSAPPQFLSGSCTALTITTSGADGVAGNVVSNTTVQIGGTAGSALFYTDSGCTSSVAASAITAAASTSVTTVYVKDDTAESLILNVVDPAAGGMNTTSGAQSVTVLPSQLTLTGPAVVRSGDCSGAFSITVRDAAGNAVNVTSVSGKVINFNGLAGHASIYSSNTCGGSPLGTSVTIPQGQPNFTVYVKDQYSENLTLNVSDPAGSYTMATSSNVSLAVWPRTAAVSAPAGNGNSVVCSNSGPIVGSMTSTKVDTSICAGPFTATLKDGNTNTATSLGALTLALGGANSGGVTGGGAFYSDAACTGVITTLSFANGESAKQFYYTSTYPGAPTLTTDGSLPAPASALAQGSIAYSVNACPGWIGSKGDYPYAGGENGTTTAKYFSFVSGVKPARGRIDAPAGVDRLHFTADYKYLFASERQGPNGSGARIHMYDYQNSRYIGWIGTRSDGGTSITSYPMKGSFFNILDSDCLGLSSGALTRGWCQGGIPQAVGAGSGNGVGKLSAPTAITDDGTFIYVYDAGARAILRYRIDSTQASDSLMSASVYPGGFSGWIGVIGTTPTRCYVSGSAVNSPNASIVTGSVTPGWCNGGAPNVSYMVYSGDATNLTNTAYTVSTAPLVYSGGYLYLGLAKAVYKFDATTGQFVGYIGRNGSGQCKWCTSGAPVAPAGNGTGGITNPVHLMINTTADTISVVDTGNPSTISPVISVYTLSTGDYLPGSAVVLTQGYLSAGGNVAGKVQIADVTSSGTTTLYAALGSRLQKLNPDTGAFGGWIGRNNGGSINSTWASGTSIEGFDEQAFSWLSAVAYDGAGHLLTGDGMHVTDIAQPAIKKWDLATGNYLGSLVSTNSSPTQWSIDRTSYSSLNGFDDKAISLPMGSTVDLANLLMYLIDSGLDRIKKIDLTTGASLGWIGVATTSDTGGTPCGGMATLFNFTNMWCSSSISATAAATSWGIPTWANDGRLDVPTGLASDGTYLYALDTHGGSSEYAMANRIMRYKISDGSFQGWTGGISNVSTGALSDANDGPANSCSSYSGNFASNPGASTTTPGWCVGGRPSCGAAGSSGTACPTNSGNGTLTRPTHIYYYNQKLYVVDNGNHRVARFSSSTGAFDGWIGKFNGGVSGSCAVLSGHTDGWCNDPANAKSVQSGTPGGSTDAGGGFAFGTVTANVGGYDGITGDGNYLYISNGVNNRIDRFNLSSGKYVDSIKIGTSGWSSTLSWTNSASGTSSRAQSLWTDGTNLYAANPYRVLKFRLSDGLWVGWKGASTSGISVDSQGWISSGLSAVAASYTLFLPGVTQGGFTSSITGLSGDSNYIYISDQNQNRVIRITK